MSMGEAVLSSRKKFATSIMIGAAKILLGSRLVKEVIDLVVFYEKDHSDISGIERKALLTKEMSDVKGAFIEVITSVGLFALSVVIDIAHAWLVSRGKI